jgi:photosystem II stability/assembly factor-like uncharacterized protein
MAGGGKMRKKGFIRKLVVFCVWFVALHRFAAAQDWENKGREMMDVRTLLVDPANPQVMYAGTGRGVFRSENAGQDWRNVLQVKGDKRAVNMLAFALQGKNSIYAATGSGLFLSLDSGARWRRIFKGRNYSESDCSCILINGESIYLGTGGGLFFSRDKGVSWQKEKGRLGKERILSVAAAMGEGGYLYVASNEGAYRKKRLQDDWERVYVARSSESEESEQGEYEDRDEEYKEPAIRYLAVDPASPAHVCLAGSRGAYESRDSAETWRMVPEYGLLSRDIHYLVFSEQGKLYAVSKSGIFSFNGSSWQELSFGLSAGRVNSIALDNKGHLYACADKGLFRFDLGSACQRGASDVFSGYFKDEPGIREVQAAAIKYAEVSPDKISRWRKLASMKAWLPKLTADLGRNTTDLWHWEGGSTTRSCDDELRRGRDSLDWDVGLSWDLGEIIWSSDQTSIDVRSRLMVQLRDDIMDEVNKTYFERIRVKMELDSLSLEERKKRLDKELRIKELTASLDALTGGYFSQSL